MWLSLMERFKRGPKGHCLLCDKTGIEPLLLCIQCRDKVVSSTQELEHLIIGQHIKRLLNSHWDP